MFLSAKNAADCCLFLRLLVHAPGYAEHGVRWYDVGVGLCTSLGIDGVADIAQVVQQVEGIEHDAPVLYTLAEPGIPDKLVGIH